MTEVVKLNISLYPKQLEVVDVHSKQTGLNNRSAAIRQIISDWAITQESMAILESQAAVLSRTGRPVVSESVPDYGVCDEELPAVG